jgi:hypothetical protein
VPLPIRASRTAAIQAVAVTVAAAVALAACGSVVARRATGPRRGTPSLAALIRQVVLETR